MHTTAMTNEITLALKQLHTCGLGMLRLPRACSTSWKARQGACRGRRRTPRGNIRTHASLAASPHVLLEHSQTQSVPSPACRIHRPCHEDKVAQATWPGQAVWYANRPSSCVSARTSAKDAAAAPHSATKEDGPRYALQLAHPLPQCKALG